MKSRSRSGCATSSDIPPHHQIRSYINQENLWRVIGWNTVLSCLLSYRTHTFSSSDLLQVELRGDVRHIWHPTIYTTENQHAGMQDVDSYLHSGGGRGAVGGIWSETYRQTVTEPHPESRAEGRTTLWASAPVNGPLTTSDRKFDSFLRIGSFEQLTLKESV